MEGGKPRIAIVGLGRIGASLGLALREADVASHVVGHDRRRDASNQAKKSGAVDATEWNLVSACEGADIVVLAIPLDGVRDTMKAIAANLRPGCVVLDMALSKVPVLKWAEDILPSGVHFVGLTPILPGSVDGQFATEEARANLFDQGLMCLVPSATADKDAVKLAADLVALLGAQPLFLDAAEHDGLLAAVEHTPGVLAFALLDMVVGLPSWRELRKVAGSSFDVATRLADVDVETFSEVCVTNRDNIVRWLDAYASSLARLRGLIAEGDAEDLAKGFEAALIERRKWYHEHASGNWGEGSSASVPDRPNLLDTFLGSFLSRGLKRDK